MFPLLLGWVAAAPQPPATPTQTLEQQARPAVDGVDIIEVHAHIDGIPLATPLSRRLVDREGRQLGPARALSLPAGALPAVALDRDDAVARAQTETGLDVESIELVVQPRADGLRPVWRVDPHPDPRTLFHPLVYVDAVTGAVAVGPDRTLEARARVFARNPVLDAEPTEVELAFVDPDADALRGTHVHALQCVRPQAGFGCAYLDVPPDADGDWLPRAPDITVAADNRDPEDAFAPVSVFAHADRFMQLALAHGWGELPCPTSTLVANYRFFADDGWISYGNAAWTGDCGLTAAFGQGSDADWGYDGDVVHHELTHGLVERLMGPGRFLGFRRDRQDAVLTDALAINEGIADFIAAVVSGDPRHAEYVTDVGGSGGRDADNVLRCPEDVVGEAHYDSEIVSGALWSAYGKIGEELARVVLLSVALLEEDTTFEEASAVLVDVARDRLGAEAAAVLEAELEARGLLDCPRVAQWHRRTRELWIHPQTQPGHSFMPMRPPAVQLAFTMPPDRRRLAVRWSTTVYAPPMWAPDAQLEVLVRFGAPIAFSYLAVDDDEVVTDTESVLHLRDANEGFEVEAEPGTTVYVAVFNQFVTSVVISDVQVDLGEADSESDSEFESELDSDSESDSDSDSGSQQVSNGGCGCRTADPTGVLLLLLSLPASSPGGRRRSRSGRRRRIRSCRAASR